MSTDRVERLLRDRPADDCDATDRLNELRAGIPDGEAVDTDRDRLRALADGTRYRLARVLHGADGEVCVCELTPLCDVSESAVSHALADLVSAGLVDRRKDGKWRFYRATESLARVFEALDASRAEPGATPADSTGADP